MGAIERLERLPGWPARMTAPVAAAYMGISQTTFLTRFGARGIKEGANTLWARAQLDRLIEQQFALVGSVSGADTVEDEIAAWKAGRGRK